MKLAREKIWGDHNPYQGFDMLPKDAQGWRINHPILNKAAEQSASICELGVWKGASVIDMAKANPYCEILAVDTWRGSAPHWIRDKWRDSLLLDSKVYDLFRSNIIHEGLENRITPLPLDTNSAHELVRAHKLDFDLLHIDAGHDYVSCYSDLIQWSSLAKVIVVDDYRDGWHEVDQAVDTFVKSHNWWISEADDGKARLDRVEITTQPDTGARLEGADVE